MIHASCRSREPGWIKKEGRSAISSNGQWQFIGIWGLGPGAWALGSGLWEVDSGQCGTGLCLCGLPGILRKWRAAALYSSDALLMPRIGHHSHNVTMTIHIKSDADCCGARAPEARCMMHQLIRSHWKQNHTAKPRKQSEYNHVKLSIAHEEPYVLEKLAMRIVLFIHAANVSANTPQPSMISIRLMNLTAMKLLSTMMVLNNSYARQQDCVPRYLSSFHRSSTGGTFT